MIHPQYTGTSVETKLPDLRALKASLSRVTNSGESVLAPAPKPGAPAISRRSAAALTVEVATTIEAMRRLAPEWAELHSESGTSNPFTHPQWVMSWSRTFLQDGDPFVIALRRDGKLIGVAPFSWVTVGRAVRALHLMGNRQGAQFTEIPGVLASDSDHRDVFRRILGYLTDEAPRWDWVKLTFDPTQGWFEPQWLPKTTRRASPFYYHQTSRAFVTVDLPSCWDTFLTTRKRNVRESIRRSTNRLDKLLPGWHVEVITDSELITTATDEVIELHADRARMEGKPHHPTMFTNSAETEFYRRAVRAMAADGLAEVSLLRGGGRALGGLITLRAGETVFTSVTGAASDAWHFGPGTILIAELIRREIGRGTQVVNLSSGPNQSKLRWSERLEYHHDFVVGGSRVTSKLFSVLYTQGSALAGSRRALDWDTRSGPLA